MDPITRHHYKNIAEGKSVQNEDGSLSTVKTFTIERDGVVYLMPSIFDGVDLSNNLEEAERKAFEQNVFKPFRGKTVAEAEKKAQAFDKIIHKNMKPISANDAQFILKYGEKSSDIF
tara:strand:+ start:197 stop:547 length:351 start_codon:yes stop_codon:yes gene_type:complete